MMSRKAFVLLSLLLVGAPFSPSALAYGREGHMAIAELAKGMLSTRARAAVSGILGADGGDLAGVASWADDLKEARRYRGPLSGDPEALAFNMKFPENGKWHFVDLPLGSRDYRDDSGFASRQDIVHEINECIHILESPKGAGRFERRQALRLLIHLVGDVHQPLHVGTGYYDLSGKLPRLIEDPAHARGRATDRGGNLLRYGNNRFSELHAYWDTTLVARIAHTRSYRKLALALRRRIKPHAWKDPGDYHGWAERWASDSVHQARAAYAGIVFLSAKRGKRGKLEEIRIRLPAGYERNQLGRASDQLAKAGLHLANLLNAIRWADEPGGDAQPAR